VAITLSLLTGVRTKGGWGEISLLLVYLDINMILFVFGLSIFILLFSLLFTFYRKQIITSTSLFLVLFLLMFGSDCSYTDISSWTGGWYEVGSVGRYLSELDGNVIYDEDFYETSWGYGSYYIISFWADRQIEIGDIDNTYNSYIITQQYISLDILYRHRDGRGCIFVYENSK